MVTFPAPPQHPVALGCCRSSARPRRGSSACRHQAPTCRAGLSAPPLLTMSDKPCSSSRLSPRDLHPQALPTKLRPHMEGTLLSTGHQHVGSRSRILLGQIPTSPYRHEEGHQPRNPTIWFCSTRMPNQPRKPKAQTQERVSSSPTAGRARLLLSQASFWHKASQSLATVGPVPVTNPVASGHHPASSCAGIEHLLLVVTCRSPQT